mmetsp:Transcript_31302/g.69685  ORF Transcript_31302/g.69685 Transcript_31302/m.69685 type:complete len:673 (-) Transcript_31302:953-2971(-)|eukprot:CAMPEP_0202903144 /NCGR_PEP_ID=MMETSP1392-20130828/22098_1 /ASSEMBLY_ACC=CAM_ASM_000868 /TAXON_ID=225041 /ORGANISM="Chlamydomonas chlamydogama, Strain SAG 11-48b" /LENGTH=672 /DNA_ID=CAMNT_0049590155 /DNA_START=133 /DNA_END=2151 /DNA_ORIENTATION=-
MDVAASGFPWHLALAVASAIVLGLSLVVLLFRGRKDGSSSQKPSKPGSAQAASQALKARISDVEPDKPRVRLLYGTQTGTAERFCKQLANELRKKFSESTIIDVIDIENYKAAASLHREKLVVLCMATYGDGEPTDNAAEFYSWLLKEAESVENGDSETKYQGLAYAVFGLGNKQYEHFNAVGKKVFKALGTLGATPLLRRGDGDDDGCIDDDFDKWCAEFHAALDTRSDLVGTKTDQLSSTTDSEASISSYEVDVLPAGTKEAQAFPAGTGHDVHSPHWARITRITELHTSESDRSCVHAEVDISGSPIKYEHGDYIVLYAQNSPAVVEEVANLLGYSLDQMITLRKKAGDSPRTINLDAPFPGPISIRHALSYFADVLNPPKKDGLAALAAFATDKAEAEKLRKLAAHGSTPEYRDYVFTPQRSLLEVLRDFPSAKPPLGVFFGCIAPRLQPRFYSISSSPKAHPNHIHVTCAVVKETTKTGRVHEGICSSWLQKYGANALVPMYHRPTHFKLPKDASTPVIMVGPGTGLAPFRGFLQERAALKKSGAQLGPAVLFFGCRNRKMDYIYQAELEGYLSDGVLTALHVAFSREGASKDYVQHHMDKHSKDVWGLLNDKGAHFYVCGDAKHMAKDVHRSLINLVQEGKGCSGTEAEGYVKQLQDAGRYMRDVW